MEQNGEIVALSDIVAWSENQRLWQRDALRRLYQTGELTVDDITALVKICKGTVDQSQPITKDHIRDPKASVKKIKLKSICNIENVNALAPNQKLQFSINGMTVVYGDNGSGKSGYIRILKQVCRSRNPKADMILPNIYNSSPDLLKAHISFMVEDQEQTFEWVKDCSTEKLLSSVSVFDSSTANIHVDSTNDVAYIPFPMLLLSKLADACRSIKAILQSEIDSLIKQTPDSIKHLKHQLTSDYREAIGDITSNTDPKTIEHLATITPDEEKYLQQLQIALASDPIVIVRNLNAKLEKLNVLHKKAKQLFFAISEKKQIRLKALHNEYLLRKQAAELAATVLFQDDPLSGVGGNVWKILWEAARDYSQSVAYIEKLFPVTDQKAYCVLCQQELDEKAKERLARFEEFVIDKTTQEQEKALNNFEELQNMLCTARLSQKNISDFISFCKNELNDLDLANTIRTFFIKGRWRLRALLKLQDFLPDLPTCFTDRLSVQKNQIIKHISDLSAKDAIATRQKLINEKNELEDRKRIVMIKDDILAEIERKKKIDILNILIKRETPTTPVTIKSTNISESLVTNALKKQFTEEVNRMNLINLAIELKQEHSVYGAPKFKVSLKNRPDLRVGHVLSEGEFHCIALAAFLAELATTQSKSGIVFDDPISSLDHAHREAVAERLVTESLTRQVIVFTHDLHFLFLLGQCCRDRDTEIYYRHITKCPNKITSGICHNDAPPKAQDVRKRIQSLNHRLKNEKIHYEKGSEAEWDSTVRSLQNDIRFTWELAVEDFIGEVITRFRNKVETRKLARLTVLTSEDCEIMRNAYGRCSNWLHSNGIGLNPNLPSAQDIQEEIKILSKWHETIRQKQRSVPIK